MEETINNYWAPRLNELKTTLEANRFEVFMADSAADAKRIVLEEIIPGTSANSLSWGGSMTVWASGLLDHFRSNQDGLNIIDVDEAGVPWEELYERRRKALLSDLFITGTNAITEAGQLVNLDAVGNRVDGITFGPKYVIILVGRNKLVTDLDAAMTRIKKIRRARQCQAPGIQDPVCQDLVLCRLPDTC